MDGQRPSAASGDRLTRFFSLQVYWGSRQGASPICALGGSHCTTVVVDLLKPHLRLLQDDCAEKPYHPSPQVHCVGALRGGKTPWRSGSDPNSLDACEFPSRVFSRVLVVVVSLSHPTSSSDPKPDNSVWIARRMHFS